MPARPRANRTPDGAKKRWSADDRARRSPSPRTDAPSGARGARRPASESPRDDRRTDWYPGPRDGGKRQEGERGAGRGAPYGSRDARPYRATDDAAPARRPRRSDERDTPAARRPERAPRQDRDTRPGRDDRPQRTFRADRPERPFRADRPERAERPFRADRPERAPRSERPFRADRPERAERPFRADRPERAERPFRAERPERAPRSERPFRADRPERADRSFRSDRPDRAPRTDRPSHDRPARSFREDQAPRWVPQEDVVLERLEAQVVTADEVADTTFGDLGLGPQITKALADLGATAPFPIQAATIPHALDGRDVLGRGRTGSGKTIAFGAALVERLMRNWAASGRTGTGRRMGRPPRALILAPTRELALQIDRTVQPIARAVGLFTTQIVGGVPQGRQVGALAKGVDIVIGTPGRIEDLLEQRRLDLGEVEIAVLDEADHMADLGFLEPIQRILRHVPAGGQRLMFSATLDSAVSQLVDEFLDEPAVHEVADAEGSGTADHRVLVIEQGDKMAVLTALLGSADRSLVFARTRAFAEQLADDLDDAGVRADSLHGDLNQARRTRNLARFSEGRVAALVATDVAARGIHVDDIELVIHADAAEDYKTYLHRSGRTGRAGASGTVITLINPRRRRRMTELLERAGVEAQFVVLRPGADPVAAIGR